MSNVYWKSIEEFEAEGDVKILLGVINKRFACERHTRDLACKALMRLVGNEKAEPFLIDRLEDPNDDDLRLYIVDSLSEINGGMCQ